MKAVPSFCIDVSEFLGAAFDMRSLNRGISSATIQFVNGLAEAFRHHHLSFNGFIRYYKAGEYQVDREMSAQFPDDLIVKAETATPKNPRSFGQMARKLQIDPARLIVFDDDWWRALAANSAGVGLVIMTKGVPESHKGEFGPKNDAIRLPMWERFQSGDLPGSGQIVATRSIAHLSFE